MGTINLELKTQNLKLSAGAGALGGLLGVLALLLWQAVGRFAANAALWLPYPYPRPGSEGLMLYETVLLRQGGSLYGPITPAQFISGPYPPVYYWLAGQIMPATAGFTEGRTLSLWAAVAVAVCAIATVLTTALAGAHADDRRQTTDNSNKPSSVVRGASYVVASGAGLVAAGLWLAAPPVLIWATRFRADMLMMAFQAAGLLCVAAGASRTARPPSLAGKGEQMAASPAKEGPEARSARRPAIRNPKSEIRNLLVWLAIPCFVLALFTKQTALAGPLAAAAFLLVRDWRRGLIWITGLAVAGGVPFLALDLASANWFALKMVDYHSLPWSLSTFTRLLSAWQEDHLLLIVGALGYAAWCLLRRRNDLIAWYLAATLVLLPTAGVVGADHNHLLAVDLALALAAGAGLAAAGSRLLMGWQTEKPRPLMKQESEIQNPKSKIRAPALALIVLVILCGGYVAMAATPADWYAADFAMPSAAVQTQLHKIVEFIRQAPPGPYFADDPGLLALAGKTTDYDDPFTMTALAAAGRWDASTFEDALRRGAFPYVFLAGDVNEPPHLPLRADILTPEMRAAVRQGYQVLFPDVYFTYRPRK